MPCCTVCVLQVGAVEPLPVAIGLMLQFGIRLLSGCVLQPCQHAHGPPQCPMQPVLSIAEPSQVLFASGKQKGCGIPYHTRHTFHVKVIWTCVQEFAGTCKVVDGQRGLANGSLNNAGQILQVDEGCKKCGKRKSFSSFSSA